MGIEYRVSTRSPFTFIHKSQLQTQNSIYASYKVSECISFNEENEI